MTHKTSINNLILVFHGGPMDGHQQEITFDTMVLGRDLACDLTLDDAKVSRRHCYFERRGNALYLTDLESTNGSLVNSRPIKRMQIQNDDVITIGSTEIRIRKKNDYKSISFTANESIVTSEVKARDQSKDALAEQFASIFDFYKDHVPESSNAEQFQLVKTQRLVNSLQSLYSVTTEMARLLPTDRLLKVVANSLFEVFAGVENLVILLYDREVDRMVPAYAQSIEGEENPQIEISTTVLRQAIEKRSTLVINDISDDSEYRVSESIMNFKLKAAICAPLIAGDKVLGALYLDNRQESKNYDQMDAELVSAFASQAAVALENAQLCDTLQSSYVQTLQSLVKAIEAKDNYTRGHSQRVVSYARGICQQLGQKTEFIERLCIAGQLHDIGKIGVSEGIINKPGNLTDEEYSNIKNHVILGVEILEPILYLHDVIPFVLDHHERWDGTGYPNKKSGESISLGGRILCAADAFDAMTSQRAYNKPMGRKEAAEKILSESGKAFDPEVAQALYDWAMSHVTQSDDENECLPDDTTGSSTDRENILDSTTRGVQLASTPIPINKSGSK